MKNNYQDNIHNFIYFLSSANTALYSSEKIKLGLLVPITGTNAEIGKSIIKASRMAINKINYPNLEIIPKDTGSNPNKTFYQQMN